jgi:hypothetical protein
MSKRAADFVDAWVRENAVTPIESAPVGDDSEARLRAEACLAAAKTEGIAREDIEEETGDLVAYMSAVITKLVNRPEIGSATMDDRREQLVRTKAFYIWLDEGRPEGRAEAHWHMANDLVATEEEGWNASHPVSGPKPDDAENEGKHPKLSNQKESSAGPRQAVREGDPGTRVDILKKARSRSQS